MKGKVVIFTGKKDCLSEIITNSLIESGAEVYDLNKHHILEAKLNKKSPKISKSYNFSSLCRELSKKSSRLNISVNYINITLPSRDTSDELKQQESLSRIIERNLSNAIEESKLATKLMKKSGFSSVINIIRFIENSKYYDYSGYVNIQNSLNFFTKRWANDLIKDNVRVNNIILVNVADRMTKNRPFLEPTREGEDSLMGTVIFLASHHSFCMTGQNIFHFDRR